MVVEYIRYTIDDPRAEAFEAAYRRSGEALRVSPHSEQDEVSRCSEDPMQYVRDGLLITGQKQYSEAAAARLLIEGLGV